MKWKCVCSAENEMDVTKCPNCKREIPSYLKLEVEPSINIDDKMSAELIMSVVMDLSEKSEKDMDELTEKSERQKLSDNELNTYKVKIVDNLKQCNKLINYLRKAFPDFIFTKDDEKYTYDTVQSGVFYLSGQLNYMFHQNKTAMGYFEKSYKLQPDQVTLFSIAKCVRKLPIESGESMFKASRDTEAGIIKRELEESLLKGVVSYDHLSPIGIKAAKLLIQFYNFLDEEN
jgi:thiol-disulfide isomerase/thioredoxin